VSSTVETVERALAAGGEADDVLRAVVAALADEPTIDWAAIAFLEEGSLVVGPQAGEADEARRTRVPVLYEGSEVGELWVDGTAARGELERVAELLADYVLVGWDTAGERWQP
jgi:hypothetical protein